MCRDRRVVIEIARKWWAKADCIANFSVDSLNLDQILQDHF